MSAKENLLLAVEKGYRFDENDNVIGLHGKSLSLKINKRCGYPKFTIKVNKKTRPIFVHRFKAYKLYGDKMFGKGVQVRHLNGNKNDFSDKNISIGTQSKNMMDIPVERRLYSVKQAAAKKRKFVDGEVEQIRKMVEFGIKAIKIAKLYGVRKSTMSYIVNRKTYK